MSTKKVESGFVPGDTPTLVDSTPPETAGYFAGQLIMLTPEIVASGGYDKGKYGAELDVTPQDFVGIQKLPSPAIYNVPIPYPFPANNSWKCPVPAVV